MKCPRYCSCSYNVLCGRCKWRMAYRWTILACAVTAIVYWLLGLYNIPPPVGAFGISRWWDVAALLLFGPLTVCALMAQARYSHEDHICISVFIGWLAGIIFLFWKGCLTGFLAVPIGMGSALSIYYLFQGLNHILSAIVDHFGWWIAGEPCPDRRDQC